MLTRSAGVNFQPCENEAELLNFAEKEAEQHFFLFVESKDSSFLYDFSRKYPNCNIVVVMLSPLQEQMNKFLESNNIDSFVAATEGEFEAYELLSLLKKFQTKKLLNLEKYLNFPAIFNEKAVKNSHDKKTVLTLLEGFVSKISGSSLRSEHYSNRICDLADELLISAIFNATPRFQGLPQNPLFELNENEVVKVKWGFDGEVFGLSVLDQFGSLQKKTFLEQLEAKGKKVAFADRIHGGLGTRLIYERLHHYIINVNVNKSTEVICLLRLDKKFKDFDKRLRSFHYLKQKDESLK